MGRDNLYIVTLTKPFDCEDETTTFCRGDKELSILLANLDKDNWKVKFILNIDSFIVEDYKEFIRKDESLEFGI